MVAPCHVHMVPGGLTAQEPSWPWSELNQAEGCELWMFETAAQVVGSGIEGTWHPGRAAMSQLVWYR